MTRLFSLLLFKTVVAGPLLASTEASPDYSVYAELLDRYVTPDGVLYDQWFSNPNDLADLDDVLAEFAQVDYTQLEPNEATAFLINLYNAAMIAAVFDHYPLDSVRSIGLLPFSIFRRDFIELNGEKVSLDEVEKGILLEEFGDPRIHFAVNCASESCPALRGEPFTGDALDAQMDEQTRLFANGPHAAKVSLEEESTAYSELFKWYDADFPGDDPATYLNQYRDDPLPEGFSVEWIPYDWALNSTS
ncbi:MAG: DUF547 domain-containing protein [Verrucomicrobiota bacterium]